MFGSGPAGFGFSSRGKLRRGRSRYETTLSVSGRATASVAEWDELRLGLACFGALSPVVFWSFIQTTLVQERRPINAAGVGSVVLRCDESVRGESVCGKLFCVLAELGTTPVQARFPIDAGGVGLVGRVSSGRCMASLAGAWRCLSCFGAAIHATKLVQARGRINAGGLGFFGVWLVGFRHVMVGRCMSRRSLVRVFKHGR
jgi:hypothetical protein